MPELCPSCDLFGDLIEMDELEDISSFTHECSKCGLKTSHKEEFFIQMVGGESNIFGAR